MSDQEHAALTSMREKLAAQQKATVTSTLAGLKGRVAPALIDKLTERSSTLQMSDDGSEEPAILLSELVTWLDESSPEGGLTTQMSEDTEGAEEQSHHEDGFFDAKNGGEPSDEEVDRIRKQQTGERGGGYLDQGAMRDTATATI